MAGSMSWHAKPVWKFVGDGNRKSYREWAELIVSEIRLAPDRAAAEDIVCNCLAAACNDGARKPDQK
jgi:hypothetical protein